MKQIFFHSKLKYIICLLYSLLIIVFFLASYGLDLYNAVDATFIAGFSLICVGGLSFCGQQGSFDIFSYAFAKKGTPGNRITFYDYQQMKIEKRKKATYCFVPYLVVGGFFVIISIILLVIFKSTIHAVLY